MTWHKQIPAPSAASWSDWLLQSSPGSSARTCGFSAWVGALVYGFGFGQTINFDKPICPFRIAVPSRVYVILVFWFDFLGWCFLILTMSELVDAWTQSMTLKHWFSKLLTADLPCFVCGCGLIFSRAAFSFLSHPTCQLSVLPSSHHLWLPSAAWRERTV